MSKYISNLCFKIDYMLIAEGQVCESERSRFDRNKASYTAKTCYDCDEIEECAQYCKSISNRFVFDKSDKACHCQTQTREAGRCRLGSNSNYNLYEFRYPGKLFHALQFN